MFTIFCILWQQNEPDYYMESNISNYADHSRRINFNILKGIITLEKLEEYLKNRFVSEGYHADYNILVDIREAELSDFYPKMEVFANYFINSSEATNWKRKCAIVTSTPEEVVIIEILKDKLKSRNFDLILEVFSTTEAALFWL